ncbi:MFS transporter [Anatilimnocola floriformis]|uniref:MFS transporter n=1 Tax=Anatilimnocola floriformis TaxID=2948575 RepID=UPI0020C4D3EF|nr:MFS transporter [Anatilimnocola floriformis]
MERLSFDSSDGRSARWKWSICGLLFLATMIMYMDRQTLSLMSKPIKTEFQLTHEQYGTLEWGFGLAFAAGAIINGLLADRVSVRWLYPLMLLGWSSAGVATVWSQQIGDALLPIVGSQHAWLGMNSESNAAGYLGLFFCRVVLGYFEAGHWPCALITTQRLLTGPDRLLGNSILQSGASVGSIITPLAVMAMRTNEESSWRQPFIVIGIVGMSWVIPWLFFIREADLKLPAESPLKKNGSRPALWTWSVLRKIIVLMSIVVAINMTWQYLRAWMPLLLQEEHKYSENFMFWFMMAFYLVADLGCLAAGGAVKWLTGERFSLNRARLLVFTVCTLLAMYTAVAANLPHGALLLYTFLLIGCGTLGLFPVYYSLAQELSTRRQGLVTGLFGATTWIITSYMQKYVGKSIDVTHSFATGLFWAGQVPLIGCLALGLLWPNDERSSKK